MLTVRGYHTGHHRPEPSTVCWRHEVRAVRVWVSSGLGTTVVFLLLVVVFWVFFCFLSKASSTCIRLMNLLVQLLLKCSRESFPSRVPFPTHGRDMCSLPSQNSRLIPSCLLDLPTQMSNEHLKPKLSKAPSLPHLTLGTCSACSSPPGLLGGLTRPSPGATGGSSMCHVVLYWASWPLLMMIILEASRNVSHYIKYPVETGIIFGDEFMKGYNSDLPSQTWCPPRGVRMGG